MPPRQQRQHDGRSFPTLNLQSARQTTKQGSSAASRNSLPASAATRYNCRRPLESLSHQQSSYGRDTIPSARGKFTATTAWHELASRCRRGRFASDAMHSSFDPSDKATTPAATDTSFLLQERVQSALAAVLPSESRVTGSRRPLLRLSFLISEQLHVLEGSTCLSTPSSPSRCDPGLTPLPLSAALLVAEEPTPTPSNNTSRSMALTTPPASSVWASERPCSYLCITVPGNELLLLDPVEGARATTRRWLQCTRHSGRGFLRCCCSSDGITDDDDDDTTHSTGLTSESVLTDGCLSQPLDIVENHHVVLREADSVRRDCVMCTEPSHIHTIGSPSTLLQSPCTPLPTVGNGSHSQEEALEHGTFLAPFLDTTVDEFSQSYKVQCCEDGTGSGDTMQRRADLRFQIQHQVSRRWLTSNARTVLSLHPQFNSKEEEEAEGGSSVALAVQHALGACCDCTFFLVPPFPTAKDGCAAASACSSLDSPMFTTWPDKCPANLDANNVDVDVSVTTRTLQGSPPPSWVRLDSIEHTITQPTTAGSTDICNNWMKTAVNYQPATASLRRLVNQHGGVQLEGDEDGRSSSMSAALSQRLARAHWHRSGDFGALTSQQHHNNAERRSAAKQPDTSRHPVFAPSAHANQRMGGNSTSKIRRLLRCLPRLDSTTMPSYGNSPWARRIRDDAVVCWLASTSNNELTRLQGSGVVNVADDGWRYCKASASGLLKRCVPRGIFIDSCPSLGDSLTLETGYNSNATNGNTAAEGGQQCGDTFTPPPSPHSRITEHPSTNRHPSSSCDGDGEYDELQQDTTTYEGMRHVERQRGDPPSVLFVDSDTVAGKEMVFVLSDPVHQQDLAAVDMDHALKQELCALRRCYEQDIASVMRATKNNSSRAYPRMARDTRNHYALLKSFACFQDKIGRPDSFDYRYACVAFQSLAMDAAAGRTSVSKIAEKRRSVAPLPPLGVTTWCDAAVEAAPRDLHHETNHNRHPPGPSLDMGVYAHRAADTDVESMLRQGAVEQRATDGDKRGQKRSRAAVDSTYHQLRQPPSADCDDSAFCEPSNLPNEATRSPHTNQQLATADGGDVARPGVKTTVPQPAQQAFDISTPVTGASSQKACSSVVVAKTDRRNSANGTLNTIQKREALAAAATATNASAAAAAALASFNLDTVCCSLREQCRPTTVSSSSSTFLLSQPSVHVCLALPSDAGVAIATSTMTALARAVGDQLCLPSTQGRSLHHPEYPRHELTVCLLVTDVAAALVASRVAQRYFHIQGKPSIVAGSSKGRWLVFARIAVSSPPPPHGGNGVADPTAVLVAASLHFDSPITQSDAQLAINSWEQWGTQQPMPQDANHFKQPAASLPRSNSVAIFCTFVPENNYWAFRSALQSSGSAAAVYSLKSHTCPMVSQDDRPLTFSHIVALQYNKDDTASATRNAVCRNAALLRDKLRIKLFPPTTAIDACLQRLQVAWTDIHNTILSVLQGWHHDGGRAYDDGKEQHGREDHTRWRDQLLSCFSSGGSRCGNDDEQKQSSTNTRNKFPGTAAIVCGDLPNDAHVTVDGFLCPRALHGILQARSLLLNSTPLGASTSNSFPSSTTHPMLHRLHLLLVAIYHTRVVYDLLVAHGFEITVALLEFVLQPTTPEGTAEGNSKEAVPCKCRIAWRALWRDATVGALTQLLQPVLKMIQGGSARAQDDISYRHNKEQTVRNIFASLRKKQRQEVDRNNKGRKRRQQQGNQFVETSNQPGYENISISVGSTVTVVTVDPAAVVLPFHQHVLYEPICTNHATKQQQQSHRDRANGQGINIPSATGCCGLDNATNMQQLRAAAIVVERAMHRILSRCCVPAAVSSAVAAPASGGSALRYRNLDNTDVLAASNVIFVPQSSFVSVGPADAKTDTGFNIALSEEEPDRVLRSALDAMEQRRALVARVPSSHAGGDQSTIFSQEPRHLLIVVEWTGTSTMGAATIGALPEGSTKQLSSSPQQQQQQLARAESGEESNNNSSSSPRANSDIDGDNTTTAGSTTLLDVDPLLVSSATGSLAVRATLAAMRLNWFAQYRLYALQPQHSTTTATLCGNCQVRRRSAAASPSVLEETLRRLLTSSSYQRPSPGQLLGDSCDQPLLRVNTAYAFPSLTALRTTDETSTRSRVHQSGEPSNKPGPSTTGSDKAQSHQPLGCFFTRCSSPFEVDVGGNDDTVVGATVASREKDPSGGTRRRVVRPFIVAHEAFICNPRLSDAVTGLFLLNSVEGHPASTTCFPGMQHPVHRSAATNEVVRHTDPNMALPYVIEVADASNSLCGGLGLHLLTSSHTGVIVDEGTAMQILQPRPDENNDGCRGLLGTIRELAVSMHDSNSAGTNDSNGGQIGRQLPPHHLAGEHKRQFGSLVAHLCGACDAGLRTLVIATYDNATSNSSCSHGAGYSFRCALMSGTMRAWRRRRRGQASSMQFAAMSIMGPSHLRNVVSILAREQSVIGGSSTTEYTTGTEPNSGTPCAACVGTMALLGTSPGPLAFVRGLNAHAVVSIAAVLVAHAAEYVAKVCDDRAAPTAVARQSANCRPTLLDWLLREAGCDMEVTRGQSPAAQTTSSRADATQKETSHQHVHNAFTRLVEAMIKDQDAQLLAAPGGAAAGHLQQEEDGAGYFGIVHHTLRYLVESLTSFVPSSVSNEYDQTNVSDGNSGESSVSSLFDANQVHHLSQHLGIYTPHFHAFLNGVWSTRVKTSY